MSKTPNVTRYLGGWEIDFSRRNAARRFMRVHAVDEIGFKFFSDIQAALELKPKSKGLFDCYKHAQGAIALTTENIKLPRNWREHQVFLLKPNSNGLHRLGGLPPRSFVLPRHEAFHTPFQYLGCINGSDPLFGWLEIDKLHIAYPVYEGNLGIYLDLRNPSKPKVLNNPVVFNPTWLKEPALLARLCYKPKLYSVAKQISSETYESNSDVILCGVPLWLQAPEIPRCPKTHEDMRFVCLIQSSRKLRIDRTHLPKGLALPDTFLCFGDMGNLYVFYQPKSRVMHLRVQF